MDSNTATIVRVDQPEGEPLLVALERLRRCPEEIGSEFWPASKCGKRSGRPNQAVRVTTTTESPSELSGEADDDTGVLAGGDGPGMTTTMDADETEGFDTAIPSSGDIEPEGTQNTRRGHLRTLEDSSAGSAVVDKVNSTAKEVEQEGSATVVAVSPRLDGETEDQCPGSSKWAGRLRPRRSPRAETRQQGEM